MKNVIVGENDLGTTNPALAAEWHPTKNGALTPQNVTVSSSKNAYWNCVENHEWEARIGHRSAGSGCPYCAGKRVLIGFNDLETTNPELAAEWHPVKNGMLTPQNVTGSSSKNAYWKCLENHEWLARIGHRSAGSSCPYCAGKRLFVGFNDLATTNPELISQWHPTKNGALTPQDVTAGLNRKVYWICGIGHEWKATIFHRANGSECPFCSGKRVLAGFNDLGTTNPELVPQWHPTKNGTLTPKDVMPSSNQKAWWRCGLSHEWETTIGHRSAGRGCPYCAGYSFQVGVNDLATGNPELAAQWHPMKNGSLSPKDVAVGSTKRVWWLCSLSHEWETTVSQRSANGTGCPICLNKRVQIGFNDLATVNPVLAAEWHPIKNGRLTPRDVTFSTTARVWWRCLQGHEWETKVCYRAMGSGCPKCSVGVTERKFREAFETLSKFEFETGRIPLFRPSRKRPTAQIDMFNDDLKVVIEYDGEWTHGAKTPEGKTLDQKLAEDKETTQALVDIGFRVIRIRNHSFNDKLPFVPLDLGYAANVFQVVYKSFGKDKDDIGTLTRRIIEQNADWFKLKQDNKSGD